MLFCISIYRLKHTKFIDMVHMRNEISVLRSITPKNFSCLKWRKSEFPCSTHLPASFYFPEYLPFSCWVSFIFAKKNHKITEHRLSSLSRPFRRLYLSFRRLYHVWRATFLQRFFSLTSLYYFIMIIYFHFFIIVRYRSLHCMILELKHNIAIIDHIDYNCFNGNSINIWFDRNLSNK